MARLAFQPHDNHYEQRKARLQEELAQLEAREILVRKWTRLLPEFTSILFQKSAASGLRIPTETAAKFSNLHINGGKKQDSTFQVVMRYQHQYDWHGVSLQVVDGKSFVRLDHKTYSLEDMPTDRERFLPVAALLRVCDNNILNYVNLAEFPHGDTETCGVGSIH